MTYRLAEGIESPARRGLPRVKRWFLGCFAALVLSQTFLAFMGSGDRFCVGHNGYNSSAYLQAARNTLRWGALFPVQYYTGQTPPTPADGYTHHPLAMHLHNVVSLELFGDHEASVRVVPAFFGVLALIALVLVVRRLYGDATALVAGAIYVVSPINAIFTNMSNHENGFIFWTLLFGLAYLRFIEARAPSAPPAPSDAAPPTLVNAAPPYAPAPRPRWGRWYAFLLVAFFWSAMWDWPSYYCALIVACHWFAVVLAKYRQTRADGDATTRRRLRRIAPDLGLLAGFSVLVLGLFVGHFLLVGAVVGTTDELQGVFRARQGVSTAALSHHLEVVPVLMFTVPILVVAGGWLLHRAWLAVRGRFARRDILALTFAIAGLLHYYIFRGTAVVHEYWGWTLVPFVSIVCAHVLVQSVKCVHTWLGARLATRPRAWRRTAIIVASAAVVAVVALPLGERFLDLVPRGRAVGGSLWFGVEPTRPRMAPYVSGRDMARFMAEVNAATTRNVGVIMDPAFRGTFPYEPRVEITLDREIVVQTWSGVLPTRLGITEGWVYIAPRRRLSERRLAQLANEHPVYLYDGFVMVDLRRAGIAVRVFESEPAERSLWTWYWEGPWADAVTPVAQPAEEARLEAKARSYRAGP